MTKYTSVKRNSKGKLIYTYSREQNNKYRRGSCIPQKVQQAKRNAKRKNIEFTITSSFMKNLLLKQNNKCFYSGEELGNIGDGYLSPSIDRKDNSKGYTQDNVQWVSWRVNEMKKDMEELAFLELCRKITERATTIPYGSTSETIADGSSELVEIQ